MVIDKPIACFEGTDEGVLTRIVFENGDSLPRSALFFSTGQEQGSSFAKELGCEFTDKGAVATNSKQMTSVPGLYVAGDSSSDAHVVIVAAAEGAKAAININNMLLEEDSKLK